MHHELRQARDHSMDAIALNHAQRTRLANPSPECDSLVEYLLRWVDRYKVPADEATDGLRILRELISLNDSELGSERATVGILDQAAAAAHQAARPAVVTVFPSIKRLAGLLRPHLQVLVSPSTRPSKDIVAARRAVRDIVRATPADRLRSESLRHELRATAHDQLLFLMGGQA